MRQIKESEKRIIEALSKVANISIDIITGQKVWEINPEMGSIRSKSCRKEQPVKAISTCEYTDTDGTPVVVTLLLTEDGFFGELDFWKVTDEPIIGDHPSISSLKNFIKI
ncbi:DUF6984 family protein [Thalassospira alkalitolerans]|uniref:DUF6984 domain-containing protein n=1 Tax=Thalassospira alkalitolerans TaxID=1293890 RepID=A0A1Y2LDW4_9PROT|nr:hypothetical protein [Thalassospira alkalitolerans]OSQ49004.1 hypothetical protein TALK_05105 [Thalassospira alkalitolerans]